MESNLKQGLKRSTGAALATLVAVTGLAVVPQANAKPKGGKSVGVKVMTRNLFLGADLGPAINAAGVNEFVQANGEILREVDRTDFPRRAPLLAAEIRRKKPDLVGLQEVSLWREGPPSVGPALSNMPVATEVRYDFLKLLMDELNEDTYSPGSGYSEGAYKVAFVQEQFDFEAPADKNGVPNDGTDPFVPDAELNGRLTMRDVILVRKGSGVKIDNADGGNFENLLVVRVANVVDVPVTRGFTQLDATATKRTRKGKKVEKRFRFVNSHLEAFDDETEMPSIRAQQAQELLDGPADKRRTIILGDFNSDSPGVKPGDEQAYEVLLGGGFRERSTSDPLSCCVSDLFTSPPSEFDHQVDHVMTNMGKMAKLVRSTVVGREQVGGIYPSDHAGVVSKLKLR